MEHPAAIITLWVTHDHRRARAGRGAGDALMLVPGAHASCSAASPDVGRSPCHSSGPPWASRTTLPMRRDGSRVPSTPRTPLRTFSGRSSGVRAGTTGARRGGGGSCSWVGKLAQHADNSGYESNSCYAARRAHQHNTRAGRVGGRERVWGERGYDGTSSPSVSLRVAAVAAALSACCCCTRAVRTPRRGARCGEFCARAAAFVRRARAARVSAFVDGVACCCVPRAQPPRPLARPYLLLHRATRDAHCVSCAASVHTACGRCGASGGDALHVAEAAAATRDAGSSALHEEVAGAAFVRAHGRQWRGRRRGTTRASRAVLHRLPGRAGARWGPAAGGGACSSSTAAVAAAARRQRSTR